MTFPAPGSSEVPDDLGELPMGELRQDPGLLVRDLLRPTPRAGRPANPWKRLFAARDAHELLGRLADGDPLDLRGRVRLRLRAAWLLLHPDRVLLRSVALVAFRAPLYSGRPPVDFWCDQLVGLAVQQLLQEDAVAEAELRPATEEAQVHHMLFRELFGIAPAFARRASVRFHGLPEVTRRLIWHAVVEGAGPEELEARGLGRLAEIRARLEQGLETLASPNPLALGEVPTDGEETP
jgi:hypothetical protein